jgi:hypothetical protein
MLKLHETLSHALFQAFVLYRGNSQVAIVLIREKGRLPIKAYPLQRISQFSPLTGVKK